MSSSSLKSNAARDATEDVTLIPWQPFSVLSPYLTTCFSRRGDPTIPDEDRHERDTLGYDPRYLNTPSLHSLPEEMPNLIRQELQYIFFEATALHLRHEDDYKIWWRRDASMTCAERQAKQVIEPKRVYQFLNKELIVYFETSSVSGYYSSKIARYIYREWLHLHDGRPPFQRHGFFAKAVQISKTGPQNLQQLSSFHHRICQQLSGRLDDLVNFYPKTSPISRPPFFEPIPSRKIQSWRDSGYILCHLFRALYIVVDGQALAEPREPDPVERDHDDPNLYLEGIHDRCLSRCTVLLVKTGDEAHLHCPISFVPLFDAGLALNVNRGDYHGNVEEETVVRVKLKDAVRFVCGLLGKEEEAIEKIGQCAEALRQEQDAFCKTWVERVMSHSGQVGIDNNAYTWLAIRRTLARMNSEAFEEDQVNPMWERVRHWIC